jgi:4-hydroxythreonine-4-phosphate dehydrogenase
VQTISNLEAAEFGYGCIHAPIKVLGLEAGVNITVGLPIICTSVDHGTAFDIAGTGVANELSVKEALRQAIVLSPNR